MKSFFTLVLLTTTLGLAGCTSGDSDAKVADSKSSSFALEESEPEGAVEVGVARASTQDGDEVTLVGRIGGSKNPFVDGLAAFTIVDLKVPYCSDDEGCPTPWDYCCKTDAVKENIATVKIVDDSGQLLSENARDLLKINELSTVVVKGKAKRDDVGNLTVTAKHVFVRDGR